MITVRDDDQVETHDDASALLRYAVPGATVEVYRPRLKNLYQRNSERSRAYSIVVRRMGVNDLCVTGSYSLPTSAARLLAHTVEQVRKATGETK